VFDCVPDKFPTHEMNGWTDEGEGYTWCGEQKQQNATMPPVLDSKVCMYTDKIIVWEYDLLQ
jgi:hypothetical protein